jgi:hypothetical protein
LGFAEKQRQRKTAPEQDQPQRQNSASTSDAPDEKSQIAGSALTPPSTLCASPGHSLAGYYEDSRSETVVDWDFLLEPSDRYGIDTSADDFWTTSLNDIFPLPNSTLVINSEDDSRQGHRTPSNSGDYADGNETGRVQGGPTVLHRAVRTGNSKVVRLLLEHRADCNSRDNSGLTPLLCATIEGHEEVLELLLSRGADIKRVDNSGQSALHWAVLHNRHRILRRLLSCCEGDASLLNRPNKDGETPLSVAVGAGSELAVKLLLEFGATVNVE